MIRENHENQSLREIKIASYVLFKLYTYNFILYSSVIFIALYLCETYIRYAILITLIIIKILVTMLHVYYILVNV